LLKGILLVLILGSLVAPTRSAAQTGETRLRVIAFGAHPDDCDGKFGGTAAKFAKAGAVVKFVSVTNGDAGHQSEGGGALANRRRAEAQEAGRRLGIAEYEVLDNHDGELVPSLDVRKQIIRAIRRWNADLVLAPRPNDYHPDHRYTGVLIQDAAYMVMVPNVAPDVPPLKKNPVFLYFQDGFQRPNPFRPDVAVAIDDVWETKMNGLDAHVSQVYEWLPWVEGHLEEVPKDAAARRAWLSKTHMRGRMSADVKAALEKRYGPEAAQKIRQVECFELCEYGRRPSADELQRFFPK
jgi:LmbE family N-acetylglucosaminyl deacetylase